jgi:ribosomal-protein-alanine N-acetyltransferase
MLQRRVCLAKETGCLHNTRMILETERLILDTWQASDWTAFRPIATDPEVMRYITGGAPWTDDQIRGFVERQVKLYSERGFCRWKLLAKATGETIGFCGVGFWRDAPEPEIGWWLARRYWGRGLATEAARTALRDAFERAGLERVISVAMPENAASIRIMEKLGLKLECEFENDGVRLLRYALSRLQYFSRTQPLTRSAPADDSAACGPPSPPRGRGM